MLTPFSLYNVSGFPTAVDVIFCPNEVNEILSNGHAWADDHIATSSDDIEEVKNFLVNELSGNTETLIQEEPAQ